MKKTKLVAASLLMSGSILFSSCIGSFGLWNQLKSWNQGISNKFVNEIVFFAFHVIPVYEVCYLADVLVLNSIEFWSGSNPLAEVGTVRTVEGDAQRYSKACCKAKAFAAKKMTEKRTHGSSQSAHNYGNF